jgi:acyl-CoA synthetase (NDP forming)
MSPGPAPTDTEVYTDADLSRLFTPEAIALVGASADPSKLSGRPLRYLEAHGYPGDVFLVNPSHETVDGHPCYACVSDLPSPPDVALVLVPAALVEDVVSECGAAGIPFAVVVASGFAETGPEGEARQSSLFETAREAGVRLLGPNSEGFLATRPPVAASFSSILKRDDLLAGPVGFVTQSGGFGGALFQLTQDAGVGASLWVSTGNEADLDTLDVLSHLVDDRETRVVATYVESLRRGKRLLDVGRRAAVDDTALVTMRVGASDRGQAAAASHTGSVATADRIYDGVFRQAGVVRVRSVDAFLDTVTALVHTPAAEVSALATHDLGVVSISGGAAVLIADTAARLGVDLATLDPETGATVSEVIPDYGSAENPLDVTAAAIADHGVFADCLGTVAGDSSVGSLLVQFGNSGREMVETFATDLLALRDEAGIPVLAVFTGSRPRSDTRRRLVDGGVLVFADPVRAVRTVGNLTTLARARDRLRDVDTDRYAAPSTDADRPFPGTWDAIDRALSENDVGLVETAPVDDAEAAVAAGDRLDAPLVLKYDPLAVAHKTEEGGVHLSLRGAGEVREAFDALASTADYPVVAQQQVSGVEVLVGIERDPDFGPVVTLGPGGVWVELFDRFAHRALPVTHADVDEMVDETPLARLLAGYRGADGSREALCDLVVGLTRVYAEHAVDSLECNPVVVTNEGAWVVDLLVD